MNQISFKDMTSDIKRSIKAITIILCGKWFRPLSIKFVETNILYNIGGW